MGYRWDRLNNLNVNIKLFKKISYDVKNNKKICLYFSNKKINEFIINFGVVEI